MPIPYTREAIATLRAAARNATPHAALVAQFGWSPGMLDRVCRDHGINIAPPGNAQTPAAIPPLPVEQLAQFIEDLPRRQAAALKTLRAASLVCDGYIPASAILGGEMRDTSTRNVSRDIGFIAVKMADAHLPYRIEHGWREGYRLLFTGAKS